jgi:hypothetical protein
MIFLLIVLVITALGTSLVMLRHRTPSGDDHHIAAFQKEMKALSPEAIKSTVERHRRPTTAE